jgi:hypothetical protein
MDKRFKHRKPNFLRAFAVVAWALQGMFASWSPVVHAANPDTMALSIRASSNAPPAAIADLLASPNPSIPGQISLTWSAPQGNAGGTPIANLTVARYTIHLATFSVDSLSGNTTAWWNSTTANSVTLEPPSYTPQSPGSLEAHTYTGLTPGTRYYFGIRSVNPAGIESPIDSLASTPTQQASATALPSTPPTGTAGPKVPNGLLSTSLSNGLQVRLTWTPVTQDTSGNPVTIAHYLVHKYSALGSTATAAITVSAATPEYTENTAGLNNFYRIQAVSTLGILSQLSDYLDSSGENNRYALAADDPSTRVVMPREAALYLLAENNPHREDIYLTLAHQPQDEVNITLRSYKIAARRSSTDEEIIGFAFPQNNISVQLGYGAVVSQTNGFVTLGTRSGINAATLAQIISVYWYNGASFIRVGNPLLTLDQAVSVSVRNLGIYQIRALALSSAFRMAQGSPYPRVITPNGNENRRVFFFFDNPAGDPIRGTIYDLRGAHVRDLQINSQSPTGNSLVWDGRDNQGAVVPSGIYLYKISAADETITGTVVVAR